jgi:hypothetical protein
MALLTAMMPLLAGFGNTQLGKDKVLIEAFQRLSTFSLSLTIAATNEAFAINACYVVRCHGIESLSSDGRHPKDLIIANGVQWNVLFDLPDASYLLKELIRWLTPIVT